MIRSVFKGSGSALPKRVVTNAELAKTVSADVTLRILPEVGHGIPTDPIRDDVLAFFNRTLKKR